MLGRMAVNSRNRRPDAIPRSSRTGGATSVLRRLERFAAGCVGSFVILSIVLVLLYRHIPPPVTQLMVLRLIEGYGLDKDWRPLDEISPTLIRAVIASEDQRFCRHHGFDWNAIENAWEQYQSGEGELLGASTISMQTAKNVFLWPARDWRRKGLEAYFTALIELAWSKRWIIEVYLNIAEWGPGIYGAEAAAQHYFGKPASRLRANEAARLAAVLPAPLDRSASHPDPEVRDRASFILRQLPNLPAGKPPPCGEPS